MTEEERTRMAEDRGPETTLAEALLKIVEASPEGDEG